MAAVTIANGMADAHGADAWLAGAPLSKIVLERKREATEASGRSLREAAHAGCVGQCGTGASAATTHLNIFVALHMPPPPPPVRVCLWRAVSTQPHPRWRRDTTSGAGLSLPPYLQTPHECHRADVWRLRLAARSAQHGVANPRWHAAHA